MIERISFPTPLPTVQADYVQQNSLLAAAFLELQLPVQISAGTILSGSIIYLGGTVYKVTSVETITGVSSEYVKLTPSGDGSTLTASYVSSLTGVTWNNVYKGYYDISGNLYLWDFAKLNLEKTTTYENILSEKFSKQMRDFIDENIGTGYIYSIKEIGNGTSIVNTGYIAMCKIDTDKCAVYNATAKTIKIYEWDGLSLVQVGNQADIGVAVPAQGALCQLATNEIAFIASGEGKLRKYSFDGTDFSIEGNDLNIGIINTPALARMSDDRVAYFDSTNLDLRAYDFDGTDWTQTGNDLNIAGAGFGILAGLNNNEIAFITTTIKELRKYSFDGTDFSIEGSTLDVSGYLWIDSEITNIDGNKIVVPISYYRFGIFEYKNSRWYFVRDIGIDNYNGIAAIESMAMISDSSIAFSLLAAVDEIRVANVARLIYKE